MKIVVQRVSSAVVEVEGKEVGLIGNGAVVLIGVAQEDTQEAAIWLARKFVDLRMFDDELGKPNYSILNVKGSALIVSQFTLYADCAKGNRPSYIRAAAPDIARELYELFVEEVRRLGVLVQTGIFGTKMKVSLVNDGPMTLVIEKRALVESCVQ
jgi:D-aminoacyl-tRNA deacylase